MKRESVDALTTPDACQYAGVCRDTLRRKLTPIGYIRNGHVGRPTRLWSIRDLDGMEVFRRHGEKKRLQNPENQWVKGSDYDALEVQRDQLREALELVLFCDKDDVVCARTKARAALAATEGKTQ